MAPTESATGGRGTTVRSGTSQADSAGCTTFCTPSTHPPENRHPWFTKDCGKREQNASPFFFFYQASSKTESWVRRKAHHWAMRRQNTK